jgi:glutamyl-tRNA synthetase
VKKRWSAEMPALMTQLVEVLKNIPDFASQAAEPIVLNWITDNGYHMGNVMNAFRLTVVGECKGPHMFDITELIGREETIKRILAGVQRISNEPAL